MNRETSHLMFLSSLVNVPPFFDLLRQKTTDPVLLDDFRVFVARELYVLLTGIKDIGVLAQNENDRKYPTWVHFLVAMRNAYLSRDVPYPPERLHQLSLVNSPPHNVSGFFVHASVLDECERKEREWSTLTTIRP